MKKLACLMPLLLVFFARAQVSPDSLWTEIKFRNSSLSFDNVLLDRYVDSGDVGNSQLAYFQQNNHFTDAYMPRKINGMTVSSERFVALRNWRFYGAFSFSKYDEYDSRHTEVANPYRDNPYKIVDSVTADWKKQHYLLQANIVSPYIGRRTRLGMGIKYEVLNGARQRDPRPSDKNIDITLTPGVMFDLSSKMKVGIHGLYHHFMQDMSVSMENSQCPQNIYKQLGLGEYLYNGPVILSGSLSRIYVGNTFGGGADWFFQMTAHSRLSAAVDYRQYKENVTEGTSTPYNAGTHTYREAEIKISYGMEHNKMSHLLDLQGSYRTNADTEYVQTLSSVTKQYEVVYASEMHDKKRQSYLLHYKGLLRNVQGHILWQWDGSADFLRKQEHYPSTLSSESYSNITFSIGARRWMALSSGNLSVMYLVKYRTGLDKYLIYHPKANSTNFVAYNILYPNYAFNTAEYLSNALGVQFDFKKRFKNYSRLYFKAMFEKVSALSDSPYWSHNSGNNYFTLTVGLFN